MTEIVANGPLLIEEDGELRPATAEDFRGPPGDDADATAAEAAIAAETSRATAAEAALNTAKQSTSEKAQANGYASLDGAGKIPATQLPNAVMEFQGMWNAATNTPNLADGTANPGDVYRVSNAATVDLGSGAIAFKVNDQAVYGADGKWYRSRATDDVTSVARPDHPRRDRGHGRRGPATEVGAADRDLGCHQHTAGGQLDDRDEDGVMARGGKGEATGVTGSWW